MNTWPIHSLIASLILTCTAISDEPKPAVLINAGDYETIQAALNALPASGGMVRLPPGTIEIDKPLEIKTPETRIEGSGASTHIKNSNSTGKPAFLIQPGNFAEDNKAKLWRIQLGNFRISGNEKSGDGIRAVNIQEIFLQGMSIDHNGGHGIALIDCYEDPRVSDSILTYNKKAGLYIDGNHDIVVNANHFEENEDAVVCIDSFNLCMNGNNIDDHLGNGVVIENTYGSVVSGNMIEECNGTAIILDRDCYGITLSANVIAHHLKGGIDLRDANGCTVSGNTFVLTHHFGVKMSGESGRNTVTGNNFSNTYIGGGLDKRPSEGKTPMHIDIGTGVVLKGSRHIIISGNSFSGMDQGAVSGSGGCRSILVNGNVITDINRRSDQPTRAIDLGDGENCLIKDNLIDTP
ncbi:MAG: right-handed parallel beta-helix repeat-containing protein [Verrucomicrobiales bacterium]|nr:right-handed parallel beta-helix repeat-containing protein [Verrucomicrobiales bacterium]